VPVNVPTGLPTFPAYNYVHLCCSRHRSGFWQSATTVQHTLVTPFRIAETIGAMPYRDRNQRLATSRAHHARHRPSPVVRPQHDGTLPPYGAVVTSDDGSQIQCHVCGHWFRQLPIHTTRMHGLNAAAYKEAYGLARSASLLSPQTAELQRRAALARDQAHKGVPFGPDNPPQKRTGITNRLSSKIRSSQAQKGAAQEEADQVRAVGDTEV